MKKVLSSTNSADSTSTTMVLLLWDIIIKQLASPTEVFSHTNTTIYANLLHLLLSATQRTYDLLNFLTWKFMSMPPLDIYRVHGLIVAMPTIKNLATAWRPNVTPSSIMWASIQKKPFGQSFISKKVWSVCQILWLTTVSTRWFSAIDRILCSIILADFWLQDGRFTMISQTIHLIMLISRLPVNYGKPTTRVDAPAITVTFSDVVSTYNKQLAAHQTRKSVQDCRFLQHSRGPIHVMNNRIQVYVEQLQSASL